jgi:D-3-phosphoglycerate dehydrogenase / 2-oxoglutarate reductase
MLQRGYSATGAAVVVLTRRTISFSQSTRCISKGTPPVNIIILDDYQDAVRKLACAAVMEQFNAKVFTNTVKGIGQLSVRLRDADVLVLIRERTHFPRQLLEKLPKLKLIAQTGRVGGHIDLDSCTQLGIAVAEGSGSPTAPAELTWALIMAAMRRLPQYIGNLKHGAWQQSGMKSASMPPNFGLRQSGHFGGALRFGVWHESADLGQ